MSASEPLTDAPQPWRWGQYVREETKVTVPALLWTLHDMGGGIKSSDGRAAHHLAEMAKKRGMPFHPVHQPAAGRKTGSLSQLMGELDRGRYAGSISREVNGKRTLRITLLLAPEQMPPRPHPVVTRQVEPTAPAKPKTPARFGNVAFKATQDTPDVTQQPVFVQSAPPVDPQPEPEPTPAPEPQPEPVVDDAAKETVVGQVAVVGHLLNIQDLAIEAVKALLSTPAPERPVGDDRDYDQLAARLATTLEENNRLRRKLAESQETAVAKHKEAEGLRRALINTQNNLRAIQEASAQATGLERNLAKLNGTQKAISSRPEPAIVGRQR